jgi:hydrogenase maturation protease
MTGARAALIGIGNGLRRDDGVGPALLAEVAEAVPAGVRVAVVDDPWDLLDLWLGVDVAVVVDAVMCAPASPGQVHRFEVDLSTSGDLAATEVTGPAYGSTHGFDVGQMARLAQALGRAPRRLVVYGVEPADVALGEGISPELAAGLADLGRRVLAEIVYRIDRQP